MAEDSGQLGEGSTQKRLLEDPQVDDRVPKHHKSRPNARGQWINPSFTSSEATTPKVPVSRLPLSRARVEHAADKSKTLISPSFSMPSKPGPSHARLSTPSVIRAPLMPQTTPRKQKLARPLSSLIHTTPQSDQPASQIPHSTPRRSEGRPLLSLAPSPLVKAEEKFQRPLSSRPLLLAESSSRSTLARREGDGSFLSTLASKLADSSTSHGSDGTRVSFSLDVKSEESEVFDEVDRGFDLSPEKAWQNKGKRLIKNGLAERASETISRLAKDQVLWQNSITSSAFTPDIRLRVTEILSVLPGRILTRCLILNEGISTGMSERVVLFGPGTKELQPGLVVGAWRPWGELELSSLTAPYSIEAVKPTAFEDVENQVTASGVQSEEVDDSGDVHVASSSSAGGRPNGDLNAHSTSPNLHAAPALLITRFLVLDS